ncbi:unnamed protein product [Cyclocybe aegerita]|uniref:Uncharacterized protein n=1 Tax=Cyclocybe aegerita TaxID=1973307 RepID=A0A8S0WHN4_CYCAE|nr:unnamed protein product [Cyclocybe aegerita]
MRDVYLAHGRSTTHPYPRLPSQKMKNDMPTLKLPFCVISIEGALDGRGAYTFVLVAYEVIDTLNSLNLVPPPPMVHKDDALHTFDDSLSIHMADGWLVPGPGGVPTRIARRRSSGGRGYGKAAVLTFHAIANVPEYHHPPTTLILIPSANGVQATSPMAVENGGGG